MTQLQLEQAFATEEQCRRYLERLRWPDGQPCCPKCNARAWRLGKRYLYECSECGYQFSALIGTIFEKTHLPLTIWFRVLFLMAQSKKGISAHQVKRMFGIHYRTAWYLCHRARTAMQDTDLGERLMGVIEIDETYIGPKSNKPGRPGKSSKKVAVLGMIQRGGKIVTKHVENVTGRTIKEFVDRFAVNVEVIHTDEYRSYGVLDAEYAHKRVNHSMMYSDGDIHCNGVENFWSLLKRGLIGSFHKVSVKHLHLYLDEFTFRFNNREFDVLGLIFQNIRQRHIKYAELVA